MTADGKTCQGRHTAERRTRVDFEDGGRLFTSECSCGAVRMVTVDDVDPGDGSGSLVPAITNDSGWMHREGAYCS